MLFSIAIFLSTDSRNNVVDVIVDVQVPKVICQFQNGPVASAECTIEYGTDPVNLENTDTSTDTNVFHVTIPLSVTLQHDTLYHYVVSTMGVRIEGTFRTGMLYLLNTIAMH